MVIDEIFEETLFPDFKEYLESSSEYNVKVTKKYTQESKVFPIVTMILTESSNKYNNLSYGEQTENFNIDINIYSNDIGKTSKRTICNEITKLATEWWLENYHVLLDVRKDIENIDNTIHRNYVNVSGVLDLKLGKNKPIINPTLRNSNNSYWK